MDTKIKRYQWGSNRTGMAFFYHNCGKKPKYFIHLQPNKDDSNMKIKNIQILPALLIVLCSSLVSCGVDRWKEYAPLIELDEWITSVMRENYLWYQDIPQDENLNFFISPDAFLKTIVSKEDYSSSFIDTLRQTPAPSYGFDYSLYRVVNNDTAYNALITYILPDSPASRAGLKRGDYIMKVNDEYITKKSETKLLNNGKAIKLVLGKYVAPPADVEEGKEPEDVVQTGTAALGAEQPVEDNPINYHTVLTSGSYKVGYLVYSHFTAGPTPDSQKYNDELRSIFREFADAGITYFILDVRYNTGGSLECAQLLSTMLAPASVLDTPFASLEYNDKLTSKNHNITYNSQLIGTGANLNIQQGFMLSSSTTSGITGTMLNCLSPLKRWALVGSPVSCHGVATEAFVSPKYPWSLNPVVCTVKNSAGESGRGGSFTPNATVIETTDRSTFLPFGDPKEALLSVALGIIDGTYPPAEAKKSSTRTAPVKQVINTPSRKAAARSTL